MNQSVSGLVYEAAKLSAVELSEWEYGTGMNGHQSRSRSCGKIKRQCPVRTAHNLRGVVISP